MEISNNKNPIYYNQQGSLKPQESSTSPTPPSNNEAIIELSRMYPDKEIPSIEDIEKAFQKFKEYSLNQHQNPEAMQKNQFTQTLTDWLNQQDTIIFKPADLLVNQDKAHDLGKADAARLRQLERNGFLNTEPSLLINYGSLPKTLSSSYLENFINFMDSGVIKGGGKFINISKNKILEINSTIDNGTSYSSRSSQASP